MGEKSTFLFLNKLSWIINIYMDKKIMADIKSKIMVDIQSFRYHYYLRQKRMKCTWYSGRKLPRNHKRMAQERHFIFIIWLLWYWVWYHNVNYDIIYDIIFFWLNQKAQERQSLLYHIWWHTWYGHTLYDII